MGDEVFQATVCQNGIWPRYVRGHISEPHRATGTENVTTDPKVLGDARSYAPDLGGSLTELANNLNGTTEIGDSGTTGEVGSGTGNLTDNETTMAQQSVVRMESTATTWKGIRHSTKRPGRLTKRS